MERNSVRRAKKGESQAKIRWMAGAKREQGRGGRAATSTVYRRRRRAAEHSYGMADGGMGVVGTKEYANDARCMCRRVLDETTLVDEGGRSTAEGVPANGSGRCRTPCTHWSSATMRRAMLLTWKVIVSQMTPWSLVSYRTCCPCAAEIV